MKETYNYLGLEVVESSDDDDLLSIELEYDEYSVYPSDGSYMSGANTDVRISRRNEVKRKSVEPLCLVDKLETLAMVNLVSDILDLVCKLSPYVSLGDGDITGFNNKLQELMDTLYSTPNQCSFKKSRAYDDILNSLTTLNDGLTKMQLRTS